MSQHDLNIANQGFPAFRADLNDALVALGTTNSGATAPATPYANQLWYDTANNILKMRNEDNDAWISLFTLNQTADTLSSVSGLVIGTNVQAWDADLDTWATKTAPSGVVVGTSDTQTLTNKTINASQLVNNSISPNKMANGGFEFGMRNRIINGGMAVAQRPNATLSTSSQIGAVDRFIVFSGGTSVSGTIGQVGTAGSTSTNYASFISGASWTSGGLVIGQRIESLNTTDLSSKTITVQAKVYHDTGSSLNFFFNIFKPNSKDNFGSVTQIGSNSSALPCANNVYTTISATFSIPSGDAANGLYVQLFSASISPSNKNFAIGDFQLEIGSTATSFEYRQYGTELALCQRYFCKAMTASGYANTTTQVGLSGSFPVTMRTSPTMGLTGVLTITDGAANYTQSATSVGSFLGTDTGFFLASVSNFTGLTQYRPCVINYSFNGNLLTASAEL
jgi:hypothetical protein